MSPVKNWFRSCARFLLLLVPALALATPSFAQRDVRLADSQEPGSVIVFPKFIRGTQNIDGVQLPSSEIEVGIVCPAGPPFFGTGCPEHQVVKIRFHWVCPGVEDFNTKLICREINFDVIGTVNGKIVFNPENMTITGSNPVNVPSPPCPRGYLIGWVVAFGPSATGLTDGPVKYDGLVGDAVLRESGTAVASYNAIPIQAANDADPTGTPIATIPDLITGRPLLAFDGVDRHYKAVTGVVIGDVKFTNRPASGAFPVASATFLTLLTLDVRSDLPNFPTGVDINFWNESNGASPTSPLFEKLLSTSLEFVCWTEVQLTDIDPNLTQTQMGSRKGVFRSQPAAKFAFAGISDAAGPVTLLGLVETLEGPVGNERDYFSNMYNDSIPVTTFFLPE